MAKVRRVVRKTDTPGSSGFDDQFWPVVVALVVLGGFLLSVIFVYLDNQPWMFWPSLILLPIVITAMIVLLSKINSKFWRRSMQLALVISIIAHLIAFVWTVESLIFAKLVKPQDELTDLVRDREPIVAPDYTQQEQNEIQTELEEIVETDIPDPEPEELEPEREEIEEPEPERPQPTPVPDPEETPRPQIVERQETTETVPRQSESMSRLSRQTTEAQARTGTVAEVPETAQEQPSAQVEPNQTEVERQNTEQQVQRRETTDVPSAVQENRTTELARTQPQESATTETTNAPTLPREVNQPTLNTPRTTVETPDAPSVPREVEQAVQPQNIAASRQSTSQTLERPDVEATVATTAPTNNTERRERAEERPTDATTPSPVENSRPRETPRPTVNTLVENVPNPTTAPTAAPRQPTPNNTQTSPTQRNQSTPTITQTQTNAEPTSNPSPTPTNTPQRNVSSQSVAQSTPSSSAPSRTQHTSPTATTATTAASAAVAPNSPASDAIASNAATASTAVAQQSTSNASAARATPNASPSTATDVSATSATQATRRPTGATAQTVAQSNTSVSRTRTDTSATPSASTSAVVNVDSSQAPTQSSNPSPRPTASTVARQESSNTAAATRSQHSQPTETASPSTQVAGASRAQSQTSDAPSINSQTTPTDSPSRSSTASITAASPTAIESPAETVATRGAGNPALSPAATAINRSESGTAGIGTTANVDRAQPAADSPANTASNSAARAEAMQNTPTGDAFAPSEIAQLSRSRADLPTPSATMEATDLPNANRPGAEQATDSNATASAAQVSAQSNADNGPVTAARGSVEVDLGPTKVVSDSATGRASGGGQEALNFDTQANQPSRSETGGSPQLALAAVTEAEDLVAPDGTGGGQPSVAPNAEAVAVAPAESGGDTPVTGGPSTTVEQGPSADVSTGETQSETTLARTEAAEAVPGETAAGGGDEDDDEEDEEEQLARANAAGSPQLALSAPTIGDAPASPTGTPGGEGPSTPSSVASSTDVARADTGAGAPASGGASAAVEAGEVSDSGGGEQIAQAEIGRAEAVEAAPGEAAIGGGTSAPSRSVASAQIAANTQAATVSEAGMPRSSGSPGAPPADAQGVEITQLAGGAAAPAISGPAGALGGPTAAIAANSTAQGTAAGLRQASARIANSGSVAMNDSNAGAPLARSSTVNLPAGTTTSATVNDIQAGTTASTSDSNAMLGGTDVGEVSRQRTGGLVVNVQATEGPGGLGGDYSDDAGINTRRASTESTAVQIAANSRFVRTDPGGRVSTNNKAIVTAEAFENRRRPTGEGPGGANRASPETERAIEMGLGFLHKNQLPDGSWSLNNFSQRWRGMESERAQLNSDTAATGLTLLAFQGAGYTHKEWKYAQSVKRGIQWLVAHQKENGDLYVEFDELSSKSVRLYSHSIAALALCEAYGMTGDPELKEPAQKAIDFIIASQDKQRGGWRYRPGINADTSVSGWMMMALYSADLSGLEVEPETYAGVGKFLTQAQVRNAPHLYRYNPDANPRDRKQAAGLKASPSMTSVGLLMRLYSGWRADNPLLIKGADYLLKNLPTYGTEADVKKHLNKRDTYYWYYATMVMINTDEKRWKTWQDRLHPLLVNTQAQQGVKAGSWDPGGRIPDKWGKFGGRLYVTTLNLLSLEVQYRKLPLYHEMKQ